MLGAVQGYVEAGVHGGMEQAFDLLTREEYIAIITNLVRIQGRIGTETAIRVGLEVLGDQKAGTHAHRRLDIAMLCTCLAHPLACPCRFHASKSASLACLRAFWRRLLHAPPACALLLSREQRRADLADHMTPYIRECRI